MYIFWSIFVFFSLIHLVSCLFDFVKLRKITKIFIIPLLILGLMLSKTYNPFVLLGLILGWIGDVFLIFNGSKKYFIIGAFSFGMGHICYILAILQLFLKNNIFADVPIYIYPIFVIPAILIVIAIFTKTKKMFGTMAILMGIYFYLLISATLLGFIGGFYLLAIGFITFITSDLILTYTKFIKPIKYNHFFIMSTYILAQTLIVISFIIM